MPHILVVDSDGISMQNTVALLEGARYHVTEATDGRSALKLVASQTPDLVLLEVLLPDQEGFEVCRRIRRDSDVPIVFLSSRARSEDRVCGLRFGADDYIGKPYTPAELLARIKAVLRRAERARKPPTDPVSVGNWKLDPLAQRCVTDEHHEVDLTPREVHLLAFLMKRSGRVCTTGQIVRHVWGYAGQQSRSIVATSVWRLRAKLEGDVERPRHILTVRNVGYTFVP
ncbi:MAG: response regulator transcription factor [Chloroflexota bacterium]